MQHIGKVVQNKSVDGYMMPESLGLMAKSDILLLIDAPSKTGVNPFLASKLVDYLGAGKRILSITDKKGTSAEILRKYSHYVVSPRDINGIVSAVVKECLTTPLRSVDPLSGSTQERRRTISECHESTVSQQQPQVKYPALLLSLNSL